ncbi:hypothetical protein OGATHE_004805 [Ogataea polymorpha]|uniref:Uncharacterized protein n=1 Tax=Ogataea polymorpha TaxID=460523 RepID=A0A9P8T2I7_9ASCO|nr:hypothetical protein OGATHE_004805 [Ogataea polymorpha]
MLAMKSGNFLNMWLNKGPNIVEIGNKANRIPMLITIGPKIRHTKTSKNGDMDAKWREILVKHFHIPLSVSSWTHSGRKEMEKTMKIDKIHLCTHAMTGIRLTHPAGNLKSVIGLSLSYSQIMESFVNAARLIQNNMNIFKERRIKTLFK